MIQAYILLGGLVGIDAPIDSRGMFGLAQRIAQLPGVTVTSKDWSEWHDIWQTIFTVEATDKIALIGYSGGGSRATIVAGEPLPDGKTFPRVDLLVAYDPSPKWQMWPLHSNVAKAICYHNNTPLMFGLGGGSLMPAPVSPCTSILTRQISEQHLLVQYSEELHAATIQAIKDIK